MHQGVIARILGAPASPPARARATRDLPAGTYDVTVSRGPEWDIQTRRVKIGAKGASLSVRLTHVVPTPEWLSARQVFERKLPPTLPMWRA
jgi:hypothetical protein